MSSRLKNLIAVFAVSIAMWVVIIQGSLSIYHLAQPDTDNMQTASTK